MIEAAVSPLWRPKKTAFPELPIRPDGTDQVDIEAAIRLATDLVFTDLGFGANDISDVYRASVAEQHGGANCYAQAEAVATILEFWEIPSFILLTPNHASNVTIVEGKARYFEAGITNGTFTSCNFTSGSKTAGYESLWPSLKMAHGAFARHAQSTNLPSARYFWVKDGLVCAADADPLVSRPATDIPPKIALPHIVMTAAEGIETLHAIGDIGRYRYKKATDLMDGAIKRSGDRVPKFFNLLQAELVS